VEIATYEFCMNTNIQTAEARKLENLRPGSQPCFRSLGRSLDLESPPSDSHELSQGASLSRVPNKSLEKLGKPRCLGLLPKGSDLAGLKFGPGMNTTVKPQELLLLLILRHLRALRCYPPGNPDFQI
jgi:hypothetical protein